MTIANGPKIKREDFEDFVHEYMKIIKEAYLAYYPEGHYLTMYFDAGNGYFHVNNSYYDRDMRNPIDATWFGDERFDPSGRGGSIGSKSVPKADSEA